MVSILAVLMAVGTGVCGVAYHQFAKPVNLGLELLIWVVGIGFSLVLVALSHIHHELSRK